RDLDTTATDVHHYGRSTCNIDAVDGGEVDEAGFLRARNHLGFDPRFALDRSQELAAIAGFPDRARRRRQNLFDLVRFSQAAKTRKSLQRGRHRLGRQRLSIETTRSQAHHILLSIDDLEGQVRPDPDHDHMDLVGSAVDSRYPHLIENKGVVAVIQTFYNGGYKDGSRCMTRPAS